MPAMNVSSSQLLTMVFVKNSLVPRKSVTCLIILACKTSRTCVFTAAGNDARSAVVPRDLCWSCRYCKMVLPSCLGTLRFVTNSFTKAASARYSLVSSSPLVMKMVMDAMKYDESTMLSKGTVVT